jgi:hypothetical protein
MSVAITNFTSAAGLNGKAHSNSNARITGSGLSDGLTVRVVDRTHTQYSWSGTTSGTNPNGTTCRCDNLLQTGSGAHRAAPEVTKAQVKHKDPIDEVGDPTSDSVSVTVGDSTSHDTTVNVNPP